MTTAQRILTYAALTSVMALSSACVIREGRPGPREVVVYQEGYYDRDHHRYYHENAWHDCRDHDDYCH